MEEKILNIGSKSAAWLRQVGVHSFEDLQRLGSVAVYLKVKRAGFRATLNLLYSLEAALLACHWHRLSDRRRSELLIELNAAETAQGPLHAVAVGAVTQIFSESDGDGIAIEQPDVVLGLQEESSMAGDAASYDGSGDSAE